jgi:hypothetical protein
MPLRLVTVLRKPGVAPCAALWLAAALVGSARAAEGVQPAETPAVAKAAEALELAPPVATTDLGPRWSARSSLSEGTYRSAFSRGRLDVGVRFDAPMRAVRSGEAPLDPVLAYGPPAPTLSVGLRSNPAGTVATAGSLLERATGATIGQPPERKVGLEWKPAQSRIFLNRGLGIRLDGDDRVTMRLKKGSLGLYMQSAF